MHVYNSPLTTIDKEETRRYAGMREKNRFPESLLDQACIDIQLLSIPRGCWEIYRYDTRTGAIHSSPPFCLIGESIRNHLTKAVEIAVFAVTIGFDVEKAISNHFKTGEYTAGLLLDAAGSTAVEAVADGVNELISTQAARRGLTAIQRFSPGYGDWNITDQPRILTLSHGNTINISVTSTCMLEPRKSVTAVIGLIPTAQGTKASAEKCESGGGCTTCTLINCMARKEIP
jgi:hypothetical protein